MHPFLLLAMLPALVQAPAPQAGGGAPAAGGPKRPWSDVATLSYVATSGNAQGQTVGFANDFAYRWERSAFTLKASAVRVSTAVISRTATGTSLDDAVVRETRTTTTTAETYVLNGRYDHRLKEKDRFYAYAGAGWERNRPAGLDGRTNGSAGVGYIWVDTPGTRFRTDGGFGWTYERPVVSTVGFRDHYGTANVSAQLKQKLGANGVYTAELALVENLADTADFQGTLRQALTVSLNKTLAVKVGLDVAHRNEPNLIAVEVFSLDTPPISLGKVSVPARRTDTLFTTSLVITF